MRTAMTAKHLRYIALYMGVFCASSMVIAPTYAADVLGTDGKIYPGASCQLGPDGSPGDIRYDPSGVASNQSSLTGRDKTLLFVCPVIRDNALGALPLKSVQVNVHKSDTTALECTVESAINGSPFDKKSGAAIGAMGFYTIKLDPVVPIPGAHYSIWCRVPIGHSVVSYTVFEQ